MLTRPVFATLSVLALSSYVSAQDMTNAQLTVEVRSLRSQLSSISENLTKGLIAVDANKAAINETNTQIEQLKTDLLKATDLLREQIKQQEEILNAISEKDLTGRHIPRLSAAMASEKFRKDMEDVVQRSIRTHGEFEVTNKTAHLRQIHVNRVAYDINPGQTVKLTLPVGTVVTQLPGKEKETWTITAPSYWQGINIVPVASPVVEYTMSPPVYYYSGTPLISQATVNYR